MNKKSIYIPALLGLSILYTSCKVPQLNTNKLGAPLPASYGALSGTDTAGVAKLPWKRFFKDADLVALIDTALEKNQELNMVLQELQITKNEIKARKGEYLPTVGLRAGAGLEKVGRYTSQGAGDATTEIMPGKEMPDPLADYTIGLYANWELDIWKKLRNAKKAAVANYLATQAGRNFVITNLVAEIAERYYTLQMLDSQLQMVTQNIDIQSNVLRAVRIQKEASRVTELAVRRFEAQLLQTKSLEFDIRQKITENENAINFLLGRYPQTVARSTTSFNNANTDVPAAGLPSQLLANRPDIQQAELQLAGAQLNVKIARAQFYPSVGISASIGYQAFNPSYLFRSPESLLYGLGADLIVPLINRNAIKANFSTANAQQTKALFKYQQTSLNAYKEVANQLAKISNLKQSYALKAGQVDKLNQSVKIATDLFKNARADYMEVLLTQKDALEAKFELAETRKEQLSARINAYRALGGGWRTL